MNNKIELSPELIGVLLTEKGGVTQDSVNDYMKANNFETEAEVVENTASEINLCLPYYSWLDDVKAESIGDSEMTASGGDHIHRLPATTDSREIANRNFHQLRFNLDIIFAQGRPDLADHSYDGDYNYHVRADMNAPSRITRENPK